MKISLSGIVRWIVGLLFVLVALGSLIDGAVLAFLLSLLIVIICIPVIASPVEKKLNLSLSGPTRFVIVLVLFMGFGMVVPDATPAPSTENIQSPAETQDVTSLETAAQDNTQEATPVETETPELTPEPTPEPTLEVTPEPTPEPSPTQLEPEPVDLSGNGPEATSTFKLEKGLSIFTMTYTGSSNFIVWLMDANTGQNVELLANAIGSFDGSKSFGSTSEGDYILNIQSDGPWEVTVEQPRQTATQSVPLTLSGDGQKVSEIFYLENGLRRIEMKHDGSSNFIVWLIDDQGNKIELLANEIGSFEGSKAIGITNPGTYMLDISADGNWEISIE
jgi:hypothetical protein